MDSSLENSMKVHLTHSPPDDPLSCFILPGFEIHNNDVFYALSEMDPWKCCGLNRSNSVVLKTCFRDGQTLSSLISNL